MIVIPDIHGRSFWKKAVGLVQAGEKVIFLGDYLDPYLNEVDPVTGAVITPESAIDNFKEILQYKKEHNEQVILLLGNHDTEYFMGTSQSRCDRRNFADICGLFESNLDLFTIGYHCTINGQRYTFSHSCITEGWSKQVVDILGECHSPEEVIDKVNSLDLVSQGRALNQIGWERGGHDEYGSMIWADVEEASSLGWNKCSTFQVFSHTKRIGEPVFEPCYAMLDVLRAFRIDEQSDAPWVMDRIVELTTI